MGSDEGGGVAAAAAGGKDALPKKDKKNKKVGGPGLCVLLLRHFSQGFDHDLMFFCVLLLCSGAGINEGFVVDSSW
jgi:hypothetical protein